MTLTTSPSPQNKIPDDSLNHPASAWPRQFQTPQPSFPASQQAPLASSTQAIGPWVADDARRTLAPRPCVKRRSSQRESAKCAKWNRSAQGKWTGNSCTSDSTCNVLRVAASSVGRANPRIPKQIKYCTKGPGPNALLAHHPKFTVLSVFLRTPEQFREQQEMNAERHKLR